MRQEIHYLKKRGKKKLWNAVDGLSEMRESISILFLTDDGQSMKFSIIVAGCGELSVFMEGKNLTLEKNCLIHIFNSN